MKSGLDYFPLDTCLDDKFELIEAEFGLTGFGVVVKILQKIYGGEGYYVEFTREVALLFAKKIGVGGNVVSEIVSAAIRWGIFDREMFEKYSILTSNGIQKRYFEAVSRRKSITVRNEYLLGSYAKKHKNVDNLSKNVNISSENVNISKQSRVEESKVEESIYTPNDTRTYVREGLGPHGNVFLTDDELNALYERIGAIKTKQYIKRLDQFIFDRGATVADHFNTILKWHNEDRKLVGK